ncbi:hypothetical protein Y032_0147g2609 [Ancylostoma ceylanicum]|uniref:Uncharacterized protein n=1 Tax=Ancylostoma ceylanicum TaxID=53326 RepID=A0A016T224_9BILA|nr:hypothetical protein Y032_0147g2609 [Ancylostoma ceylanicum]
MIRVFWRPKWGRRVQRYDKDAPTSKVGERLEAGSTVRKHAMAMEKRCTGAKKRENALNQVYLCSDCPLTPKYSEGVPNARPQ